MPGILRTRKRKRAERTIQYTHTHTTMSDNNEYIKVGDEWASVDVSINGVITIRFKDPNKTPIVYDFSESDEAFAAREHEEELRQQHMTNQATTAIREGDYVTLRHLIDKQGLPASTVIPETGRTLLQELCATGSDEGFADCLRTLIYRQADLRGRVAETNGTILHLLAERGSLRQWDRVVNELSKPLIDELLCTTDNEGNTPLHKAAGRGRMDIYALVIGLCGPDSKQSELENKHGHKPYELLNANCAELNVAACQRTMKAWDMERSGKDSKQYSDMIYAEESRRIVLQHMIRYFCNSVHHRPLYEEEETELP